MGGKTPVIDYERKPALEREEKNLREALGRNIVIENYEIKKDMRGRDYAVIYTNDGSKYYTYSKVVMRQLTEEIKPLLQKAMVRVSVRQRSGYIYLDTPIREGETK